MRSSRMRPPRPDPKPAEFDMTPMIDVTFQLIVFFLVANDLSRKEIVDLVLPRAIHGIEDGSESSRVILNVRAPRDPEQRLPVVSWRGREIDLARLGRELRTAADARRSGGPGSPSEVPVLVRADRAAPWRHVQFVMQACAAPGVGIHRIQFATTQDAAAPVRPEGGSR
jgi:biopolymer transport protein ExbD